MRNIPASQRCAAVLATSVLAIGLLTSCSSEPAPGLAESITTVNAEPTSGSGQPTDVEPGTGQESTSETTETEPTQPSIDPNTAGPAPSESSSEGSTSSAESVSTAGESPSSGTSSVGEEPPNGQSGDDDICGVTDYVDDQYHFMTRGHDFVQLCSDASGEEGAILSYVFEGKEIDAEGVDFDSARNYSLSCGFTDTIPVCLVQAMDLPGEAWYGQLIVLTNQGELDELGDELSSSTKMTFETLPANDDTLNDSMMLTQGFIFSTMTTDGGPAPVGYRTAKVDPDAVTISGCTAAHTNNYPEPPTQPATGPCDETAELVEN